MTEPAKPDDGIIRVSGLGVQVKGRDILRDIDLAVGAGERVAIAGANGAGKSTLFKALSGMIEPTQGTVEVLGRPLHRRLSAAELRELRSRIGQIFQGLHLVQRLTVLENVLIGSLARHRSWLSWARLFPRREVERARAALATVGLLELADTRVDRLSGGERQKTAIARVLTQAPALILADEPTASLDPQAALEIAGLLTTLARERRLTLLTVVHNPTLLPVLSERVIGIRQGRILFDLPTPEVSADILADLYRKDAPRLPAERRKTRPGPVSAAVLDTLESITPSKR